MKVQIKLIVKLLIKVLVRHPPFLEHKFDTAGLQFIVWRDDSGGLGSLRRELLNRFLNESGEKLNKNLNTDINRT